MMEDWQIVFVIVVPILAVVIPLLVHFKNVNRGAHTKIGENIDSIGLPDARGRFHQCHRGEMERTFGEVTA